MNRLNEWCITEGKWGNTHYSSTHEFIPYETWWFGTTKFRCNCGKKINMKEYVEYSRYILARDKALEKYYAK